MTDSCLGSYVRTGVVRVLTWLFIDSVWVHRWWGCHRLPERSFRLKGRQLHVCARCTGLIVGTLLSFLLLPWHHSMPPVFALCAGALAFDGVTQQAGYRVSNNHIRFATGFGTGLTFLATLVALGGL